MKYVCIHGHFYQPPRDNPWLGDVEEEGSASPYHDWNARITDECYAPNAASRILDEQGLIVDIVNTYSRISFDFGPTLLEWMQRHRAGVHAAVVQADGASQERFSGHGSAMAQAHNHVIQPLANPRDKRTQIVWGIRDFRHRFERHPEGMWLPETAVDVETLEILAEHEVAFTILAPHQAARWRPIGDGDWRELPAGHDIDTGCPYVARLPSGRSISVFFYDGPLSRSVAFERLLSSGDAFVARLLGAFGGDDEDGRLVHIATDGETYGHHHRFGDMALAYALREFEGRDDVRVTNYGEYLELRPPDREVEIREQTSWSCAHGVERWRGDCGCSIGGNAGWTQAWRSPLRGALDELAERLAGYFEVETGALLRDPWAARDEYIDVMLVPADDPLRYEAADAFLARHAIRPLEEDETTRALRLMEMQRFASYMFTSCGWFFDDIGGIESRQVIRYAARAVALVRELGGDEIDPGLVDRLQAAPGNVAGVNGATVYRECTDGEAVGLEQVAANAAIAALFAQDVAAMIPPVFEVELEESTRKRAGVVRLRCGRARVRSRTTLEVGVFEFAVLHLGDHQVACGVRAATGIEGCLDAVLDAFDRADYPAIRGHIASSFGEPVYSLRSVFRDVRREILDSLLERTLQEVERDFRRIYERNAPLLHSLNGFSVSATEALETAAGLVLRSDLRRLLSASVLDLRAIATVVAEATSLSVDLDDRRVALPFQLAARRLLGAVAADPGDATALADVAALLRVVRDAPIRSNLWEAQNAFFRLLREEYPARQATAGTGDGDAQAWVASFREVGELLSVRVDP